MQQHLGSLLALTALSAPQHSILRIVEARRANQDVVAQLAARTSPLPPEQTWGEGAARYGLVVAKAMHATLQRRPYDAALWAAFDKLAAEEMARALQPLVLLLPDDGWEAGLASARARAKSMTDATLHRWLDALSQPPR